MRILITGGAGFVGSSICLSLSQKYPDYQWIAFDNLKRRGSEFNVSLLKSNKIEFMHGDVRNEEDLAAAGAFDVLIDAAAEPSVLSGLNSDPKYVINNNLFGSINCFNACLKHKAKLIFLSTSRVYPIERIENANFTEEAARFSFSKNQTEAGLSEKGVSENLTLSGYRSFYGATKLSCEQFLQEYSKFYGLKTAITRFGVIAGPGQMGKTDQGVVTLWMANHYWKKSLTYIGYGGTGKQVRDILHADDLVRLIDLQIHKTELFDGKIYNAGGGLQNSASLQEMTSICEAVTGNKITINSHPENRPADMRVYITDNAKIETETGWKPTHNAETVLTDIFNWLNKNESQIKSYFS